MKEEGDDRLLRAATALLASEDPPCPPTTAERDARMEAIVAAEIRRLAQQRRRQRWIAVGALAAGTVGVFLGADQWRRRSEPNEARPSVLASDADSGVTVIANGGAELVHLDGRSDVANPRPLAVRDRVVVSEQGGAILNFASGTHVVLEPKADLRALELGEHQVFELAQGELLADVAKLRSGQRFAITVRDFVVEVHGTSFKVSADEVGCGGAPRVTVLEGVVSVSGPGFETRVPAGQTWNGHCGAPSPSASVESPVVASVRPTEHLPTSNRVPAKSGPGLASAAASAPTSTLSEQIRLFESATAQKRRGEFAQSLLSLDELLAKYPTGVFVEHATVERIRIVRQTDRVRAAEEARQYLQRFPNGYARDEMVQVVEPGP